MSIRALFLLAGVALATPAIGAVYSETTNGDISGNRLTPTLFVLQDGTNTLTATSDGGDLEYLTIEVPALGQLESLTLLAYDGGSVSFIAVQEGPTFTVSSVTATAGDLFGYLHLGGPPRDILAEMGAAVDATGFVPPLPSGKYTFWIQERDSSATYVLDFQVRVVPEPSAWALLGLGLLGLFALRRAPFIRL
jgi:hypothetical protein